ncbi:hypothetical protein NITLEN_80034 [Nitrospira lenta]|uniref:Uncharacterized protein n=1 Tax=Nitrospira lenta TaxID=1436998 RepID=A0A330LC02_9BACT|nr:hypothetical protein NITLEN_80034 [Nitrospira lenta]
MREPRLPMLPEALLLRDPPEKPPPDPPLAFAKEMAGVPMSASTMHDAMTFVVFKCDSFQSMRETNGMSCVILTVTGSRRRFIREPTGLHPLVTPLLSRFCGVTHPL